MTRDDDDAALYSAIVAAVWGAVCDRGVAPAAVAVVFAADEWDDGVFLSPHGVVYLDNGGQVADVEFPVAGLFQEFGPVSLTFRLGLRVAGCADHGLPVEVVEGADPAAFWQEMRLQPA